MPSSSSSTHSTLFSSPLLQNHDVFVSFRGIDVDEKFLEHLRSTLEQKGIHSCMNDDQTLHWGESISLSLCDKIKESKIVLIIFSKNYVNSWWCLNELAYVMENKDETGQIVVPIFYDVDPLDVQKQQGEFEISENESNINKVESWRKAVEDVSHLPGWAHEDVIFRAEFIKEIVGALSDGLFPSMSTSMSNANTDLIGLDTCMPYLISQLRVGCDGVQMVGICGTWGSGKSILASSLYEQIRHQFQDCCLVENVRDESRRHGLIKLQEKILSNVLKQKPVVLQHPKQGKYMMKSTLRRTRVLIVLDDVDHLDHLTELAGSKDWFGQGSRIIIVSRNKRLLNNHKIKVIYNVRPLYMDEAMELFSKHAFEGLIRPVQGFEKLSVDMVCKSGGHPSTLISLGTLLNGKGMSEWKSTLTALEETPDDEIVELFKKTGDDGVERRCLWF